LQTVLENIKKYLICNVAKINLLFYACTEEKSDSVENDTKKHISDKGHISISILLLTDRIFSVIKNYCRKSKVDISQPEFFDNLL
jgi:hypothetical protein